MNSEESQIPESNLSSSETQNSQEQSLESVDKVEDLTESKIESASNIKDSESLSDQWLDKIKNSTAASEAAESLVDNWIDELDINQVGSSINEETDSFSNQLTQSKQVTSTESDSTRELSIDSNVNKSEDDISITAIEELKAQVEKLQQQKDTLTIEISNLQKQKQQLLDELEVNSFARQRSIFDQELSQMQKNLGKMVEEGVEELQERKSILQREIDKLERRQERIRQEMRTNFAGASQELAIRVQGFKDYLVGSLQDLAAAAEQLQLANLEAKTKPQTRPIQQQTADSSPYSQPQFSEQGFVNQVKRIRQLIDKYRTHPDYYGPPWQLRRTFEPIHAERVQDWFFSQGGRGAIKSMGSRLQNILVASAIISVLYRLYGDRSRALILIDTPEKLGEWRRGLQDCLGISRSDFGSKRGIVLFESPEVLIQRADRLLQDDLLPLVIIDETEELVNLSLLRFPLWLAFAPEPKQATSGYLY